MRGRWRYHRHAQDSNPHLARTAAAAPSVARGRGGAAHERGSRAAGGLLGAFGGGPACNRARAVTIPRVRRVSSSALVGRPPRGHPGVAPWRPRRGLRGPPSDRPARRPDSGGRAPGARSPSCATTGSRAREHCRRRCTTPLPGRSAVGSTCSAAVTSPRPTRYCGVGAAGAVASPAGRLPQPRSDLASAGFGGAAYLVGSFTGTRTLTTILASATRCLPARVVSPAPAPPALQRGGGRSAVGSLSRAAPTGHHSRRDVYVFDTHTRALRRLGRLPVPLSHAAAASYAGYAYVIGGSTVDRPQLGQSGRRPAHGPRLPRPVCCPAASPTRPPSDVRPTSSSPVGGAPGRAPRHPLARHAQRRVGAAARRQGRAPIPACCPG